MDDLARFRACMHYQPVDRVPFWYWGAWPETLARWQQEGYRPESFDLAMGADIRQSFGHWFFPTPAFAREVIEEDGEHVLFINHEGILMRELKENPFSSMPQFVKFPVATREDFRRFWSERMQPELGERIGPDWQERLRKLRREPSPIVVIADRWGGFFGPLRNLVGVERLCTLFYDDPAFLEEMMEANADLIIAIMQQVLDHTSIDAFAFWEDMAYKTAPLISPALARRYLLPRYRRVVEFLRGRGVPFIGLDSDGQIGPLIPIWLEAGLDFLYPFEVQAGMDVRAVRREYGRELRIWGGLDKRALARGPDAIDGEIDRIRPLLAEGGFLPHTDHTCPPDISFPNYRYFMGALARACRGG